MRFLLLLWSAALCAQTFDVRPTESKQGDVLHITAPEAAHFARLHNRTVRLFSQSNGTHLGLMPVSATEKPGDYQLEFLGEGDHVLHSTAIAIRDAKFLTQDVQLSRAVQELRPAPGEMETVAALRRTVSETRYWSEPFARPVSGCMVSPFGVQRLHNSKPTGNYHAGIDQRGAEGTPVHAIADGIVRIVRPFNVHGHTVGIDHGQGIASLYLHLSRFATEEGAHVGQGDVIGYVGSTGRSTAPHLHWALSVNGVAVNAAQWVDLRPCPGAPGKPRRKTRRR